MKEALYGAGAVVLLVAAILAIVAVSSRIADQSRDAQSRRCASACGAARVLFSQSETCLCSQGVAQ
jgi:hypothetical protein